MKSVIYSVTKDELQRFINESKTYGQILKNFGLENKGGSHNTLKKRIREENLDISHLEKFRYGGGWNKGVKGVIQRKMSLDEAMKKIFIGDFQGTPSQAKKYVKFYNLIEHKCFDCGLTNEWNGKPITLEMEHTDGNNHNNLLSNLKWLCPNCHSQTPTFRGRNKKIRYFCLDCGKQVFRKSIQCIECNAKKIRKVEWPTKNELEILVVSMSIVDISKKFGVGSGAIKRWCRKLGVTIPKFEKGHWLKTENKMVVRAEFESATNSLKANCSAN